TGRRLRTPTRHKSPVVALLFGPDGRTFLTADRTRTVRVWETATGRPASPPLRVKELKPGAPLNELWCAPDGERVGAGVFDPQGDRWYLWEPRTGERVASLVLALRQDGKVVARVSDREGQGEQRALFWDVGSGRPLGPPLPGRTRRVEFHPGGRL